MQLQFGTDDDDRTAGIIDALAEPVLTEPALLALQHVGERLQRALVGASDDAAAAAVVEQGVDRLLQHALFIADDDVGRAQLHQPLQAVVAGEEAAAQADAGPAESPAPRSGSSTPACCRNSGPPRRSSGAWRASCA